MTCSLMNSHNILFYVLIIMKIPQTKSDQVVDFQVMKINKHPQSSEPWPDITGLLDVSPPIFGARSGAHLPVNNHSLRWTIPISCGHVQKLCEITREEIKSQHLEQTELRDCGTRTNRKMRPDDVPTVWGCLIFVNQQTSVERPPCKISVDRFFGMSNSTNAYPYHVCLWW